MRKRKYKNSNKLVTIIFDENQEGLSNKSIWEEEDISKITTVKREGWSGMTDTIIAQRIRQKIVTGEWESAVLITADKEKNKDNKDFSPARNIGIIRFGSNNTLSNQKLDLLQRVVTQTGFKKIKSFIGREVKITSQTIKWKTYKRPQKAHIKKMKRKNYEFKT